MQRCNQLIFSNLWVGRWTIMMLIWSSGSGALNSIDKEPMGLSGFVVVTLFKKSSDSKREHWEWPMVTFWIGSWATTWLIAEWRTFHSLRVSAAMSSNSGFFFSLIASFTVPHTSSWLTLTGKIWSVGVWITQQKRIVSGMVENLLMTVYSTDGCLYCISNIWCDVWHMSHTSWPMWHSQIYAFERREEWWKRKATTSY